MRERSLQHCRYRLQCVSYSRRIDDRGELDGQLLLSARHCSACKLKRQRSEAVAYRAAHSRTSNNNIEKHNLHQDFHRVATVSRKRAAPMSHNHCVYTSANTVQHFSEITK